MKPQGVLLINKPSGVTSFKALGPIKKMLGVKVGHTGTLDRFAEGLLVVLAGSMTRMNPLFTGFDKEYEAVFTFGKETETLDPEGDIICEGPIPAEEDLRRVVKSFIGEQQQVPPKFSAVHVGGKRAYQAALAGETIEIPSRTINIQDIRIISWNAPELRIVVSCSKGTYIRSLARDIAKELSSAAYVSELKRTRVGDFLLEDAVDAEEFTTSDIVNPWDVFDTLGGVSKVIIKDSAVDRILCGILPREDWIESRYLIEGSASCALFTQKHELLGVCHCSPEDDGISYESYQFVVSAGNR